MNLDNVKYHPSFHSHHNPVPSPDHLETLLIHAIYRAAYDPDDWPNVLNILCRSCGAQAAKLVLVDTLTSSKNVLASVGTQPDVGQKSELLTYAVPLFIHPKQVKTSGLYTWFFVKPVDASMADWNDTTLDVLIKRTQLLSDKRYVAFLLLQHPASRGEFTWADSRLMSFLKKHFKQAILLFTKTHDSLMSWQLESDILDTINIGILITDYRGHILRHNKTALRYLNDEDGLYINNGFVTTERNKKCNFITDICRSSEQDCSGIKILPRPSGKPGYQISYFPLSDAIKSTSGKGVMLFIFAPNHLSDTLADSLEMAYGLSKSESKLAAQISRGMTAEEYSEKHGVSVATVRTQLRSIYKRTETKGQTKLANLLRGLEFLNLTENIDKKLLVRKRKQRQRKLLDLSEFLIPGKKFN